MDKITAYKAILHRMMTTLAERYGINESEHVETILVVDDANGQYMLFDIGWEGHKRIERSWIHVRLKNGKFWIEEDWTEDSIADYLLEAGVPNDDIVLAINPPDMRQYTDFSTA